MSAKTKLGMTMKLTKAQRESVRLRFGGRCAYCGEMLSNRWHADHFEAVVRESRWERGKGFVPTGTVLRPKHDTIENLMPACPPCNIDKGSNSLEWWREKLQAAADVLQRNSPTYRHAVRFGLVKTTGARVEFYFEKQIAA